MGGAGCIYTMRPDAAQPSDRDAGEKLGVDFTRNEGELILVIGPLGALGVYSEEAMARAFGLLDEVGLGQFAYRRAGRPLCSPMCKMHPTPCTHPV